VKRRARGRPASALLLIVLITASVGALAWAALAGSDNTLGRRCTGFTNYGSQCIELSGSGLRVSVIRSSFTDTAALVDENWRIDLERYNCDPVGETKSQCPAAMTWHGSPRAGAPAGQQQVSVAQSGESRYWPTFYSLPHTFASNIWLCTEVAVYNSSTMTWVYNAAGLPSGLRACASIHH
jgi:hypothetical protein